MSAARERQEPPWFRSLVTPVLGLPGVSRSTMMGFPCLRLHGDFFACRDVSTDALVVKLTEARVTALISSGEGLPFAPSGRRFKAWVVIPSTDPVLCDLALAEALECAAARTTS